MTINYKKINWTPSGAAFAGSLRGIKNFQDLKKAAFQILKVPKPFLKRYKMESKNNWATFGSAFAAPLRGKKMSKNNWTTSDSAIAVLLEI